MAGRPDVIGGHYHVQKKIGEGSFGVIYQGFNDLNEKLVAIKFVFGEPQKSVAPQLKDEYRTYKQLAGCSMPHCNVFRARLSHHFGTLAGIPAVHYFGAESGFNCLVMELLGPSLEEVFDRCGRQFSVGTVCLLAIEMISRVQTIHEKFLIYRDIKPDNFLLGPKDGTIYVVDFGMAKHYWNPATQTHIPYSEKKSLSGTARYMSINTHRGREQSRRDDLESLGHVFLYFLRGSLPWQGIKANTNREKYEKIGERKQRVLISELCAGYPEEFARYMEYVRGLGFEDKPKYDTLKGLFRSLLAKLGPEASLYDWERKKINVERGALVKPPPIETPALLIDDRLSSDPVNNSARPELRSAFQSGPKTPREASSPLASPAYSAQARQPEPKQRSPIQSPLPASLAAVSGLVTPRKSADSSPAPKRPANDHDPLGIISSSTGVPNSSVTPAARSQAGHLCEEEARKKQPVWRKFFCF